MTRLEDTAHPVGEDPKLYLFHLQGSRSSEVRFLLEELQMDYYLVPMDLQKLKSEEYTKINPLQTVPTLKDGEALVRETGPCNQYLLEQYSNGRLQPPHTHKEARAEYLDWQWFGEADLYPPALELYHERKHPPKDWNEKAQERLRERLEKLLGFLEDSLKGKDYILGEQFTAADIFLSGPLTIIARAGVPQVIPAFPNVETYFNELKQRPAYGEAYGPVQW